MTRPASSLARAIALVVLWGVAAAANAQAPSHEEDLIRRFEPASPLATFAEQMRTEELVPPAVLQTHQMQSADLRCRVGANGTLVGCRVDWESAPHLGLCQAAIAAAARTRLKDHFPNGDPLEGLYAFVIMVFDVGGDPPHRIYPQPLRLARRPFGPVPHPLDAEAREPPSDCAGTAVAPT